MVSAPVTSFSLAAHLAGGWQGSHTLRGGQAPHPRHRQAEHVFSWTRTAGARKLALHPEAHPSQLVPVQTHHPWSPFTRGHVGAAVLALLSALCSGPHLKT